MTTDPIKALVERLTDNLGWSERYEIEFSQVAASDLREVLNILGTIDLKHMAGARNAFERVLLDIDFAIEQGILPDIRNDMIYVEARAALAAIKEGE